MPGCYKLPGLASRFHGIIAPVVYALKACAHFRIGLNFDGAIEMDSRDANRPWVHFRPEAPVGTVRWPSLFLHDFVDL